MKKKKDPHIYTPTGVRRDTYQIYTINRDKLPYSSASHDRRETYVKKILSPEIIKKILSTEIKKIKDKKRPNESDEGFVDYYLNKFSIELLGFLETLETEEEKFATSKKFLRSKEWLELRRKILDTYGEKCQCCGASKIGGFSIAVDHIKPRATHPHLALEFDNLQVLCSLCNYWKGNRDIVDFRKYKRTQGDRVADNN